MIKLNQIQALEQKVIKAVELINRLREENVSLRAKLKSAQPRIHELETTVNTYKLEQEAIEKSLLSVLSKLDRLEDEVSASGAAASKEGTDTVVRDAKETPAGKPPPAPSTDTEKSKPPAGEKSRPPAPVKDELDIF